MTDNLIISEHIGFNTPTIVFHNGERLETIGLDVETLVKTWRKKWFEHWTGWLVLACSDREYKALQQKTICINKSLFEIFYEHKVICINRKDIEVNAVKEWSAKCEAEHERLMNELENKI